MFCRRCFCPMFGSGYVGLRTVRVRMYHHLDHTVDDIDEEEDDDIIIQDALTIQQGQRTKSTEPERSHPY
jgi:hypothetical protein